MLVDPVTAFVGLFFILLGIRRLFQERWNEFAVISLLALIYLKLARIVELLSP